MRCIHDVKLELVLPHHKKKMRDLHSKLYIKKKDETRHSRNSILHDLHLFVSVLSCIFNPLHNS